MASTAQNRLRHPPAERAGTPRSDAPGAIPAKIVHWVSRPNLSNDIRERDSVKEAVRCNLEPL
jgi:hypothetical protein